MGEIVVRGRERFFRGSSGCLLALLPSFIAASLTVTFIAVGDVKNVVTAVAFCAVMWALAFLCVFRVRPRTLTVTTETIEVRGLFGTVSAPMDAVLGLSGGRSTSLRT